ncbi:hypothetical protein EVAR_55975_1 [Eumeta japonica]|uniref:Uncharacterized protein n=1 Tax=Eumeta variegata TaxID=151549 RepID=A0A4C1Y783_EUMVA|nr:hypothetical protein EVAR_55975_1 [Eumeta japonica]
MAKEQLTRQLYSTFMSRANVQAYFLHICSLHYQYSKRLILELRYVFTSAPARYGDVSLECASHVIFHISYAVHKSWYAAVPSDVGLKQRGLRKHLLHERILKHPNFHSDWLNGIGVMLQRHLVDGYTKGDSTTKICTLNFMMIG